ncbi:MAG TPA: VOC family protein [Acidimicrobiales bacterium]|jgi:predicted 3-demethylubiquinone-9 3-methyltransferase (glyoxalase superfamily)|nr:VOC family protein [Acidimicrobiales bacterium]
MTPITPCIWLNGTADEAVDFWLSVFKDAKRLDASTYSESAPGETGSTLVINFELLGTPFMVLNAGPEYPLSPAVSFVIPCKDQADVDYYWERLLEGGVPSQCGWLTDRYGVSWQVIPERLGQLLADPDPGRADRAMQAMLTMVKIDVAAMEAAADAG